MKIIQVCFLAAPGLIAVLLLAGSSAAQERADLSITNTATPNPATVSTSTVPRNLTYNMNVINNGPNRATGVKVTFMLPNRVTFVAARFNFINAPSQQCASTATTVTCNIGTVGTDQLAGAAVNVIVQAQTIGVLRATAKVEADQSDPDTSNNFASVETVVEPQVSDPAMVDPNLVVSTVVSGLTTPTSMAFLGDNDFLVLEQFTGRVKRVRNGAVQQPVALDLPVNFFSERGLLGIALHPDFGTNHFVYLYWTCGSSARLGPCIFDSTPSMTDDTNVPDRVPLLGNRVDRFIWDGATLRFDMNLIRLHAFQEDANQTPRGNHNGGKILFGPDGKLYVYMGDNGRRGWLQNNTTPVGPVACPPRMGPCDDQFGGPEPDNAHLTGFILRLNDDGSTPDDNPFIDVQASDLAEDLQPRASAEVIANIHKLFAYGIRNGFGIAFDPMTGELWESQNGDDSGSEINHISAGFNGGWIQVMGRIGNIFDFKAIETSPVYFGLQQVRWPPTLIQDSPDDALDRLFMLPGATYTDPLLTWKFEVAPAGLGFIDGDGLGADFNGDLIVGGARDFLLQGHLYRFKLTDDRTDLDLSSDPDLDASRVIQDIDKWDLTGSDKFVFGQGFGITTDIKPAPNGNLFVVSLTRGAVYEILRRP
jgi:uncharacterized repeat protein (TIGR01451 family)